MQRLGVLLALLAAVAAEAQPTLRLTPDTLNFGAVPLGATVSGEFVLIESVGDEPILIKIHTALQPFAMPFEQRYVLDEVREGLVDSRAAVLEVMPLRTGPTRSDVAVDTKERGAYVVEALAVGTAPAVFSLAPGEVASRALEIRNPGFAALAVRVDEPAPWLRVEPRELSLAPGDGDPVVVRADASGLAPGVYRDTLRATEDGTPFAFSWRVPVSLTVSATTAEDADAVGAQPILTVSPTLARGPIRVSFALPDPAPISLRIYDARGREVATLADGPRQRGARTWQAPAPGLYLVRLATPTGTAVRWVLILR